MGIQERRKTISDELVMEFMRPRKLTWGKKNKSNETKEEVASKLPEEVLASLDQRFLHSSYAEGFTFSDVDVALLKKLGGLSTQQRESNPNLSRWERHVSSLVSEGSLPEKVKKAEKAAEALLKA